MKHKMLVSLLAIASLVGCAAGNTGVASQDCECRLVGKYYSDSRNFCPSRFNAYTVETYLDALEEGSQKGSETSTLRLDERLAVNYDAYWTVKKVIGKTAYGLAAILALVGCEKESLMQYRLADSANSAASWGELAITTHILKDYRESERAFDEAVRLEPNYFSTRPLQKRIAEAARTARPLRP